jgi:anti-anti-sigma regulatory factor
VTSTAEIRHQSCLVTMAGEFDRANLGAFRAEIEWCLGSATSVVFDFAAVTFVDGALMAALHDILEGLGDEGWLGVARPPAHIERLFRVAGLSAVPRFRVFPTLEEALRIIDQD